MTKRITDPTQVPVQLNVSIPFYLREELVAEARKRGLSQAGLVRVAIERELHPDVYTMTRNAGATK